ETAFDDLEKSAHEGRRKREEDLRRQAVDECKARIEEKLAAAEFEVALQLVNEAKFRFRGEAFFDDLEKSAKEGKRKRDDESYGGRIARIRAQLEQRLASEEFDLALALVQDARKQFPGETVFAELETQVQAGKRRREATLLAERVEAALASGNLDAAAVLL